MGQEASKPQPGTTIKVIGAGLSRTGTTSFSAALSILLGGPVYHCGTQCCLGPPHHIKSWISVLKHTPVRTPADAAYIRRTIASVLDGFVATTDIPSAQFVPELLELYPDAIVICTIRDPDAWARSMAVSANLLMQWFLRFALFPLPTLRWFPAFIDAIQQGRWFEIYDRPNGPSTFKAAIYDKHIEWLKRVVPEDKLYFYNVNDGWEPLCKILDVEVPSEVEFPRINDSEAMEANANRQIRRGLLRWAGIFAVVAVTLGVLMRMSGS